MKIQFSSVVLTFFVVCNIFVIKSEEVATVAESRDNTINVDLIENIGNNETVSSTTSSMSSVPLSSTTMLSTTEVSELTKSETSGVTSTTTTSTKSTKQPDPLHLLIPPATDKAQIFNANVTTKKPSRFQAAV